MERPLKLGVSSCLLGNPVRFDGSHSLDPNIVDTLGSIRVLVPVCPEVECGMCVPRDPMRLTGEPRKPRLVTIRTGEDHTERMLGWARKRLAELDKQGLCGFVLKSKSPSCGMHQVKIYDQKGEPSSRVAGIFAMALMERFPLLPVEDEAGLREPRIREGFIERILMFERQRGLSSASYLRSGRYP